ncbi:PIN domain-like protein [Ramaria rubella]|nr:PIN domain-like protein [Ramaria rubella]
MYNHLENSTNGEIWFTSVCNSNVTGFVLNTHLSLTSAEWRIRAFLGGQSTPSSSIYQIIISMGVQGLWQVLHPAAAEHTLTNLSIEDGFTSKLDNTTYHIGIATSIWFYQAKSSRGGKIIKRNDHSLIKNFEKILDTFGFEYRTAPGEAEAKLAHLNMSGVIDAVWLEDVDCFLFGATMVLRSVTGGKQNDQDLVKVYKSKDLADHLNIKLMQSGLILIALLCGGDYDTVHAQCLFSLEAWI